MIMYSPSPHIPRICTERVSSLGRERASTPFIPPPHLPYPSKAHQSKNLPLLHLGRHRRIQLGEALAQTGLGGHGLGDTATDAAGLAARESLGGEVVDAGAEAVVD